MGIEQKRILIFFSIFIFIIASALAIIKIAQGYRPDLATFKLHPNGLLVAKSTPDGAQIFIDGKLTSATNTTLNLPPGEYEVEIRKDGFRSWKKNLTVKKELVTQTEAYLFPTFPDLRSLTFTGTNNPVVSPDGQKIVYGVDSTSAEKNGLWVLDLTDRPLGFPREPRQIVTSTPGIRNFTDSSYVWSPDSKQLLVTLKRQSNKKTGQDYEENFLLDAGQINLDSNITDFTPQLSQIYQRWNDEKKLREKAQISKLPDKLLAVIGNATENITFAPDETKIFYTATASASIPEKIIPPLPAPNSQPESRQIEPKKIYVYDIKEDKNFYIMDAPQDNNAKSIKPDAKNKEEIATSSATSRDFLFLMPNQPPTLSWFPTSKHLFYVQPGKITILEYDNTNWVDIYTGPFEDSYAFPFPAGNKILILTSLGSENPANLYAISLR